MNECIPVEQLGTLKELREDDPKRRHAASCPRCSSLLFAFEEFTRASQRPGARVAEAEADLGRYISTHIEAAPAENVSGAPRHGRGRWFDFSFMKMVTVAAAAVLLAVVVVRWQPWESKSIVYRGEPSAQFSGLAAARSQDGSIDMHWNAVQGADAYRVTVLGKDLSEITRLAPAAALSAHVAPGGDAYYWQVTALAEGAEILTSDPQRLPQ